MAPTTRQTIINLEGEEWIFTYEPTANYLHIQGEGQDLGLHPGDINLDDEELEEDQRELLEQDSSLAGKIKAQMLYAPYGDDVSFAGDSVIPELFDAVVIRLATGQALADRYEAVDNQLRRVGGSRAVHLPTTGSELAGYDFNQALDYISNA